MTEGSASDSVRAGAAADRALVDQALADLRANVEKWEQLLAAQESVKFEARLDDIYAVCNQDGRLLELAIAPDVMSSYTSVELTARLNAVFEALRTEAKAEFDQNFGGGNLE